MTAEEFLATDQSEFGPAWRYELVDGQPVAQASPTPDHCAVTANLATAIGQRLKGNPCRAEAGSGAVPRTTAGIAPASPT